MLVSEELRSQLMSLDHHWRIDFKNEDRKITILHRPEIPDILMFTSGGQNDITEVLSVDEFLSKLGLKSRIEQKMDMILELVNSREN